jgi:hypothetical protein
LYNSFEGESIMFFITVFDFQKQRGERIAQRFERWAEKCPGAAEAPNPPVVPTCEISHKRWKTIWETLLEKEVSQET